MVNNTYKYSRSYQIAEATIAAAAVESRGGNPSSGGTLSNTWAPPARTYNCLAQTNVVGHSQQL